jgi:iron complex outermembrane receptor protein
MNLILLFLASLAWPQDYETVIEKTVFNSSSKVIIDEKTIRETKAPDLISLITTQANITLFNNNFQPPQLFIRGGESSHVLFMIDNVPTYDVSWAQKTLNLNSLDIKNVRRIEIIKGGQTVLYGGQALAGVIKIFTFGKEFQNSRKVSATVSLPDGHKEWAHDRRLGVSAESKFSDSEGFMAAVRVMNRRNESPVLDSKKLYRQSNRNLDLGYEKRGPLHLQMRAFWFLDNSFNPTTVNNMGQQSIADSDVQRYDEQTGLSAHLEFQEIPWQPRLSLYGQKGWRFFYSPSSSADVDAKFRSGYQGARLDFTPLETAQFRIRSGLNYQKEDFFLDDSTATLSVVPRTADRFDETRGAYLHGQWFFTEGYLGEVGFRSEKVRGFTEQNSAQIGLTLNRNTKLEWVTGFRAPSASQRFGIFPNENLKPETSQTKSLTHDWRYSDSGEVSLTLFETTFDEYIEARSVGMGVLQYQNTARVRTQGIETSGTYALDESNTLQISYAYQDPEDLVRDERLRRRPLDSGSLRLLHNREKWGGSIEGTGIGTRRDFFGTSRYKFAGYFLINSSLRYSADKLTSYSLRISNWFDVRPQVSIDFYGEGRQMLVSWERIF